MRQLSGDRRCPGRGNDPGECGSHGAAVPLCGAQDARGRRRHHPERGILGGAAARRALYGGLLCQQGLCGQPDPGRCPGAAGAAQPGLRVCALPGAGGYRVQRPGRGGVCPQGHHAGVLRTGSHARHDAPQDHHRALGLYAGMHHGAEAAACLYKGAAAGDGDIRIVDGDMQTIMAGLACGEPNTISWDILKNHVKVFIAAPDWVAANGMRMLAAPVKGDAPITSGESGAAPFGALAAMMTMDEYKDLRTDIGLDENSKVLLFSTEGDTDPDRYKNIVWKGLDK